MAQDINRNPSIAASSAQFAVQRLKHSNPSEPMIMTSCPRFGQPIIPNAVTHLFLGERKNLSLCRHRFQEHNLSSDRCRRMEETFHSTEAIPFRPGCFTKVENSCLHGKHLVGAFFFPCHHGHTHGESIFLLNY